MLTLLTVGGALILCIVCTVLVRWCAAGKQCQSNISSLSLKTVIITGANNGIGKETAVGLSKRKARVILACRNVSKGKKAAVEVKKRSGNDNVFFMQLDLASLDSIRYFVSTFLEKEPQLDILVNNARATFTKGGSTRTKDGFEIKMGVNHLGHFLLTNLLINRMKESRSARIVIVSSNAYQCCPSFDFENMNNDDPARYQREHNDAYRQSKLANILFNRELSKRLKGTSVTVNAVHPGTVTTRALDEYIGTFPLISRPILYILAHLFLKTPEQGSKTVIYCATSEKIGGVSGKYFIDCQPHILTTSAAVDDRAAKRLWEVSAQQVGLPE